ncbi:hypothetical protein MTO96_037104, partial [Rhipicephalus appendiculatus]
MASITWYLPLLVLLVRTSSAGTAIGSGGPLLVKTEGIKTVTRSSDGGVKGVKTITVKSVTPAAPPNPKDLPDDIDPFALSPGPSPRVNGNAPFLPPESEREGPSVQ